MKRTYLWSLLLSSILLQSSIVFAQSVSNGAVSSAAPTYGDGTFRPFSLDTGGNLRVTGSFSASTTGFVTTSVPTYPNNTSQNLSLDTSGNLRVTGSFSLSNYALETGGNLATIAAGITTGALTSSRFQDNISQINGLPIQVTGLPRFSPVKGAPIVGLTDTAGNPLIATQGALNVTAFKPVPVDGSSVIQPIAYAVPKVNRLTPVAITFSNTGDNTIVSGVAGQTIRVFRLFFICSTATNITVKDGATALTGAMNFSANQGMALDLSNESYFVTSGGNNLVLNQSGTAQCSGTAYYQQGLP